jgi:hypothetical protein
MEMAVENEMFPEYMHICAGILMFLGNSSFTRGFKHMLETQSHFSLSATHVDVLLL